MKSPEKHGLYNPAAEHDACGVGFVARIDNRPSHDILEMGLSALERMEHRGAAGADPTAGDGAGLLTQIPDAFFRQQLSLPADEGDEHTYAVGMFFLPQNADKRRTVEEIAHQVIEALGMTVLGWRSVPTDSHILGTHVAASEPVIKQLFIGAGHVAAGDAFERRLYVARKLMEKRVTACSPIAEDAAGFYCSSMSSRKVVYKGMFLADQLRAYYPDLRDESFATALALVHQRFSTNTFPAWKLAHPFRFIAHNGEINTLRGNFNSMLARRHVLRSPLLGDDLDKIWPLLEESQSDTATLDNAVELLCMGGFAPEHALATLVPEAWQNDDAMPQSLVDFYRYHAPMMEPWDGPAEVIVTNGKVIGAVLDRNGLRPGRSWLTDDGIFIMASEAGVLDIPDHRLAHKWRIQPGKILLIDLQQGKLIDDSEIKERLASAHPYREWVKQSQRTLPATLPALSFSAPPPRALMKRQQRFGYTEEDIKFILRPMVEDGIEATGSMGDDTPTAVLSSRMKPLSAYFRQEFAQVTNPPIDPIREELVMSLKTYLGARPSLLAPHAEPTACCLALSTPVVGPREYEAILACEGMKVVVLDTTYDEQGQLAGALESLCEQALEAVLAGADILVLSDHLAQSSRLAIPSLLAVSAVHHHLVDSGDRARCGLMVATGSARSVHDMAVLGGYGAEAIYPYIAYETIIAMPLFGGKELDNETRIENYRRALHKGILKTMSKMGIATFQSYCGAQIFEAVGLDKQLVDRYFCRTESQIGGVGLEVLEKEVRYWHEVAKRDDHPLFENALDEGGDYAYRVRGEAHMWTPQSVSVLQHAVRSRRFDKYEEYAQLINEQDETLKTLRGLLEIVPGEKAVELSEVEPIEDIMWRFSTGAMSFGSISYEAHSNLAIAMNRIGGKSNTGEGGEEAERFLPMDNGDSARSAIKQVASGRFGVTAEYLANSDQVQIKIAQGAKPGEGGQLPGHKVDESIARVRHSVPGVGLISPPPHHDIYSIEDIAQLIYDLKCSNPNGEVSVKLVSRAGVGTVAAGVAKAKSDHITIGGHDGGTGASPISSIKHAGTPWELGLSETHQTLVLNDLRGRIKLQVDGQIKTGRDVIIGALLGADEFGFATAPLVTQGCIMMRKCHLNTCPVGVATQDARLRKKFSGEPEHTVNYFYFVAQEVRQLLAQMGFRCLNEVIGRADLLRPRPTTHWKAKYVDLQPLLHIPDAPASNSRYHCQLQDHALKERALDYRWFEQAIPAVESGQPVVIHDRISNIDRAVGTVLSHAIASRYGGKGLPTGTICVHLTGVAGQSFGAFSSPGMTMILQGEANDYLGKGLSGGVLAVRSPVGSRREDHLNVIAGNTVLYGATSGECYCRGVVGERFAVRNSGASAVVEGCGDHGCEYMTGGTIVVLGSVGRNFAAGMSGGVAYVLDEEECFMRQCNTAMVDMRALEYGDRVVRHRGLSDEEIIKEMLEKHVSYTDSPKAQAILDGWSYYAHKFVKVISREYERALRALTRKRA